MRIVELREVTLPIASAIANAYIDFSKMTLSLVAVVTGTNGGGSVTAASAHSGEVKFDVTEHALTSCIEPEKGGLVSAS